MILLVILTLSILASNDVYCQSTDYSAKTQDLSRPRVYIEVGDGLDLTNLLDAGIRPYRFPQMENQMLEAKHFSIVFSHGRNQFPEFFVETAEFNIVVPWEVISLQLTSSSLSLLKAKKEMASWLGRSNYDEADLDLFLEAVEENPLSWRTQGRDLMVSRGFATNWRLMNKEGKKLVSSIRFQPTFDEKAPLRLRLKLSWALNFNVGTMDFHRKPIPAPPGYESLSLAVPSSWDPSAVGQSDVGLQGMVDTQGSRTDPPKLKTREERGEQDSPAKTLGWAKLCSAIIFVCGIFVYLRFRSKRKN